MPSYQNVDPSTRKFRLRQEPQHDEAPKCLAETRLVPMPSPSDATEALSTPRQTSDPGSPSPLPIPTRVSKRKTPPDSDHIRRPRNPFMLYRSAFFKALKNHTDKDTVRHKNQAELSKEAGLAWKRLSGEEKASFEEMARLEKEEHKRRYPDYVYAPQRKNGSGNGNGQTSTRDRVNAIREESKTTPAPAPQLHLDNVPMESSSTSCMEFNLPGVWKDHLTNTELPETLAATAYPYLSPSPYPTQTTYTTHYSYPTYSTPSYPNDPIACYPTHSTYPLPHPISIPASNLASGSGLFPTVTAVGQGLVGLDRDLPPQLSSSADQYRFDACLPLPLLLPLHQSLPLTSSSFQPLPQSLPEPFPLGQGLQQAFDLLQPGAVNANDEASSTSSTFSFSSTAFEKQNGSGNDTGPDSESDRLEELMREYLVYDFEPQSEAAEFSVSGDRDPSSSFSFPDFGSGSTAASSMSLDSSTNITQNIVPIPSPTSKPVISNNNNVNNNDSLNSCFLEDDLHYFYDVSV